VDIEATSLKLLIVAEHVTHLAQQSYIHQQNW